MQMPMHEFYGSSEVANDPGRDGDTVAQRKLDPVHATKLAIYMLKGLIWAAVERRALSKQAEALSPEPNHGAFGGWLHIAVQPIVANIPETATRKGKTFVASGCWTAGRRRLPHSRFTCHSVTSSGSLTVSIAARECR